MSALLFSGFVRIVPKSPRIYMEMSFWDMGRISNAGKRGFSRRLS